MDASVRNSECVVLFSGGTDSTCAAALCAEKFDKVHLLTFYEQATRNSPMPKENVRRLKNKYGEGKFVHRKISTDRLVRTLSYENYFKNAVRFGFLVLSTPGFSSLSWHLRAIRYCRDHGIRSVCDGMTKELLHFPGHMPKVRELFARLYAAAGIEFSNPVLDWDVPPDQRFTDRLIVDRHGFAAAREVQSAARTTGAWLFENGIFERANVKGSAFDHRMQHDCYPFVVYNMLAFWLYGPFVSPGKFEQKICRLMQSKIETAEAWIEDERCNSLFQIEEPA